MKFEFQTRWFRLLIEILRAVPEIRRYRAVPASLEGSTCRLLRRRIAGEMGQREREEAR